MATKSQLMSAFIKAIRLRKTTEAICWFLGLQKQTNTFHICRRIALAAAEDNLNPGVMERATGLIAPGAKPKTINMAAEIVRVCKTPNWYASPEGVHYISRFRLAHESKKLVNFPLEASLDAIREGVEGSDVDKAFEGMYPLGGKMQSVNDARTIVTFLRSFKPNRHTLRKLSVYSSNISTIWKDENYLGQIVYELATGVNLGGDPMPIITRGEVSKTLQSAYTLSYGKVPDHYLDGIHVGGKDTRFAGTHESMFGMCKAFEKFGRLHEDDTWPTSFWTVKGA